MGRRGECEFAFGQVLSDTAIVVRDRKLTLAFNVLSRHCAQ